jgi:O-6-methylguanine DNA methyltransferase
MNQAGNELRTYFAGVLRQFCVPLDMQGTDFQLSVWNQLVKIPYGETRSYAQVAEAVGRPKAVRAVGAANGSNPVAIIVPCHRVIGAGGKLTGYGGGLPLKKRLLELEGAWTMRLRL